tara:strand:- start:377 stop:817 length:441 start_codon:yes stop_codon:yes gene_type:complete
MKQNCNTQIMKSILTLFILSAFSLVSSAQCVSGNCFKGHGVFHWDNGSIYDGAWKDGMQDGNGDFIYDNGDRYKGHFTQGKKNGSGTYTWKNGDRYIGGWNDDKMSGNGKYHWMKDGGTYEGIFSEDAITNTESQFSAETPEKNSQ